MNVLWWLVPPLVATFLAMLWAAVAGRERDDARSDESDDALAKMAKALAQPVSSKRRSGPDRPLVAPAPERSHGVAVRRVSRPVSGDATRR